MRELERALGHQLLRPAGRTVALTDAGRVAFARADDIFRIIDAEDLSAQVAALREGCLTDLVRQYVPAGSVEEQPRHLGQHTGLVGDTQAQVVARDHLRHGHDAQVTHRMRLERPLLGTPDLHLVCHEGEPEALLAELALHHLDLVLAGQPATPLPTFPVDSERIASSPVDWYGPATLVTADARRHFPWVLQTLLVLLPTPHSPLRPLLDRWQADPSLSRLLTMGATDHLRLAVSPARAP